MGSVGGHIICKDTNFINYNKSFFKIAFFFLLFFSNCMRIMMLSQQSVKRGVNLAEGLHDEIAPEGAGMGKCQSFSRDFYKIMQCAIFSCCGAGYYVYVNQAIDVGACGVAVGGGGDGLLYALCCFEEGFRGEVGVEADAYVDEIVGRVEAPGRGYYGVGDTH